MNKYFKKFILLYSITFLIISMMVFQGQAKAIDPNLEINYPGEPGPLFSINNIQPLDTFSKIVIVTNNTDSDQMFAFRISSIVGDTPLAEILNLQVKRGSDILLDDTISNLKVLDERDIGIVPAGNTDNFDFIITMPNVGNEYQGLTITTADFIMGFSKEGDVAGIKTEEPEGSVLGAKLPATGSDLTLILIYSFIISGLILIFFDKDQRKVFIKNLIKPVDK